MKKPKKVVIMTIAMGGGHMAMSRNIKQLLDALDANIETKIIDVVEDAWPSFARRSSEAYAASTSQAHGFWFRVYYWITDQMPFLLSWFARVAFRRYAVQKYQEERPDLIISTFPAMADAAVDGRRACRGTAPIIVMITDAGKVQRIWASKRVDLTLTATPDTVPYLIKSGLDAQRVKYIGFPAAEVFYRPTDKRQARERLGLSPDVFTIMVTAGGFGLASDSVMSVIDALAAIEGKPYQIVLNAGRNDRLKERMQAVKFPDGVRVIVEGFTDKMPDYLRAADVVCTKAGWLTVNEALVMQCPLIIYDAIPGHEEQNVHYVVSNTFGIFERRPDMIADWISRAITSPSVFNIFTESMARAGTNHKPHAELSALLVQYLDKGIANPYNKG